VSYHIYQTEGIILSKKDIGEADRLFSILTKDFGRIDALAQGVRYLKSKLRYNLDAFSCSRFCLVATKEFWRIVDAEELIYWKNIRENSLKIKALAQIVGLLNRMVRGQEPDFDLWNEIRKSLCFLGSPQFPEERKMRAFTLLANLRVLSCLGYVKESKKWLELPLEKAVGLEPIMESTIDKALEESQL